MIEIVFDKRFEYYHTERAPLASSQESGTAETQIVVAEVNRNGKWFSSFKNGCLWISLQAARRAWCRSFVSELVCLLWAPLTRNLGIEETGKTKCQNHTPAAGAGALRRQPRQPRTGRWPRPR